MVIHNDWGLFFQCNGVILHNIFLLNCKISWTHYVSLTHTLLNHIGGITGKNVFPKTTSSSVLFWPQPKNIQFTVIEEEINQKIFRIIKLQSEWKKSSNLLIHF